ncbi:hypothetical protein RND71_021827 [Anisodus tanguticus]|uniref:Ninja-family protein n=1 Tax=Anisodus tanguticus TaxID=243964 RepID=A0AAE1RYT2_9SOLA|nr:hypothetical protein RND71_021827 [Anisodus tanguticus]
MEKSKGIVLTSRKNVISTNKSLVQSKLLDDCDSATESNKGKGKTIVFPEGNGEKSLKKVKHSHNVVTLMDTNDLLRIMPCVTTSGGIIDGKQTEGILYRFGQDKQISIVCFCHGRFFTPAEFVKHGGGEEFDNPMKYIKIAYDASVGNV